MRSKAVAPKRMVAQQQKTAKTVATFGKNRGERVCVEETIVENVTRTVTRTEDVILDAAAQLDRCLKNCPDSDIFRTPGCIASCLVTSFVDVVVGTIEVLTTIVEAVVSKIITCTLGIKPGSFPSPFKGLTERLKDLDLVADFTPPEPVIFSPDVIEAARGVLQDLLAPPITPQFARASVSRASVSSDILDPLDAIRCIVDGEWKFVTLSDLLIEIPGFASTPVTVSVCMDRECALKLLGVGAGSSLSLIAFLSSLVNPVTIGAAVATAGISAALAPLAVSAVSVLLTLLLV